MERLNKQSLNLKLSYNQESPISMQLPYSRSLQQTLFDGIFKCIDHS